MRITNLFSEFFESEKAGGLVLLMCTFASLVLANMPFGAEYTGLWEYSIAGHTLTEMVNDGLMTIFFLLIGLELEREVYAGELSNFKSALLPAIAAFGGMMVPAGFHFMFNHGLDTQSGAGIPMATDIAFAIGILSLLGRRVPVSLKIFLTALAIIDDLGAILTIAIFYSDNLSLTYLGLALAVFVILLLLNRLRVYYLLPYLIGGALMWFCMLHSGIHPTITGVLLAFAIPFQDGSKTSISYKLQHWLHKPVAFFILPVFAIANTCLPLQGNLVDHLLTPNSYGIFAGLVLGKPIGITFFSFLAVLIGVARLPQAVQYRHIFGVGLLGGIGFTMSIFITLLAFNHPETIADSKITILLSSFTAALAGLLWLKVTLRKKKAV